MSSKQKSAEEIIHRACSIQTCLDVWAEYLYTASNVLTQRDFEGIRYFGNYYTVSNSSNDCQNAVARTQIPRTFLSMQCGPVTS